MRIIYNTLSGIQNEVEITKFDKIRELKYKIKQQNKIKNNIELIIIDNNNKIKFDTESIENSSYNIIYYDKLEDIKDELKKKEKDILRKIKYNH